jgi:small subunit ribosomal protein S7
MRGKKAKKREASKDHKYSNELVARFINKLMIGGKKRTAEKIVYTAIEEGSKKVDEEPIEFVNKVIDNIRPALEVKSRRVGGANYQVPVPVTERRQETLAVRWIVQIVRGRSGKPISELLRNEMLDAYNGEGDAIKKKESVERMAEANKAFAHFRW